VVTTGKPVDGLGLNPGDRIMKIGSISRMPAAVILAAVLMASGAFAQESESKAGMPPGGGQSGMMSGNPQMMAMHSQMMAEMKAMDARLDLKVAAMNAARGHAKVDAMAAVINEMVTQHKQMMTKMMGMHDPMMMKGMKDMDDKSTDVHKEHHE
jgi:hypothetical protein